MRVEELIKAGKLEDAEARLRSIDQAGLNDIEILHYTHDVVELALAYLVRDGLERAANTVLSLIDSTGDISWGLERIFEEYLEECTPERARNVWNMTHLLPEPTRKVDVLLRVWECLDDGQLKRKILVEAFNWALHVEGRSWRTYMLSKVLNRVHDLDDYDLMLELCRRIRQGERRFVFDDFLFEEESAETCEEFVESLRKRHEDHKYSGDALDAVIEAHLKYEKELLRSRDVNPYLYRLKAVKTEDGVTFYAVRRPITLAVLLYLFDKIRRRLDSRSLRE